MSPRPHRATPPHVNFVTPPRHARAPNHALLTTTLTILALAIAGITFTQHQHLHDTNTVLTDRLAREQQHLTNLRNDLAPHHALEREHRALERDLETLTSSLPPQPRWDQHLTTVLQRLPGIGTYNPSIILSTIEATSGDGGGPAEYGADPTSTAPITLTITLNGHARERDAITSAVEAYERDPHLLTRFPGTSISSEGRYDFRIDLAFLTTHPTLQQAAR